MTRMDDQIIGHDIDPYSTLKSIEHMLDGT